MILLWGHLRLGHNNQGHLHSLQVTLRNKYVWLLEGKCLALDLAAVGADHDFKVTGLADVVKILVVELEQVGVDGEVDGAALAGLEVDALKAFQFLHRSRDAAHQVADVELHDFGALDGSGVGHGDGGCDTAACAHRIAA